MFTVHTLELFWGRYVKFTLHLNAIYNILVYCEKNS